MVFSASSPLLSVHKDILSAEPQTLPDKLSLVEEIKHRAKNSIKQRNYPEADTLYTKAIDTLSPDEPKSLSILYSNRSLCRLNLGKFEEATEDAQLSIESDDGYVKAYWRLGQALFKVGRYGDAKEAYEKGMSKLGPGEKNGAWRKEVDKCEDKRKEEKELMEGDVTKIKSTTTTTTSSKTKKSTTTNKSKTKPSSSSKTEPMDIVKDDDDDDFKQSDVIRGYKIVNGKKTSFFHNEQTEEVKKLIGDIAPKKIDDVTAACSSSDAGVSVPKDVSAWNKAGTWEEKDVTTSEKEKLRASLLTAEFRSDDDIVARVTNVSRLEGHASVATVRGKRRYIYEFSIGVDWTVMKGGDELGAGSMKFPDVDGTCDGEYEMTDFVVTSSTSPDVINAYVKRAGLKDEVCNKINQWLELFKAEYSL